MRYARDQHCVTRRIAGETIIVPVRSRVGDLDSIYTLNEVGTRIWEWIDGRTSVGQLVEAVCETHDVPPEVVAPDLAEFLGALEAAGLVRPALPG
jgi:hypothetical protein